MPENTERETLEKLHESEERFRMAVLVAGNLIWTNTPDGRMEGEQAGWGNFTGQTQAEYEGYGWAQAVHPDDAQPTIDAWNLAVAEKRTFEFEHRVRRHDGVWRLCTVRAMPLLEPDGKIREWVGVHTDVTESRAGEERLRTSERLYRAIGEAIDYGVWICTPEGRNAYASESFLKLVGRTQEEYSQLGWTDILHPDEAVSSPAAWAECVRAEGNWDREHRFRGADGEWHPLLARGVPVRNETGAITGWAGINLDIRGLKEAEENLRAAKEQVEATSRAKDDFLAALSHELRTPLTPVLMCASSLAQDPALPEEVREQMAMIRRNVELEARLIDDLLDLTRVSRGKLNIKTASTDLHRCLEHAGEIVRGDSVDRRVRILFALEATRSFAMVDSTRIQQVFWNLIKNALKFTSPGGTISVSSRNDPAGRIAVCVADDGIGISPEILPLIFDAFEQGDIAGQHRFGGLGLGLAISRAIVAAHGGTISAESAGPGLGASFTLSLPTIDTPAPAAPEPAPTAVARRGLRLLIVEDHEPTRSVLRRLFTRASHEVTPAGTIQEALALYASQIFDVVISDLGLPDGNGVEMLPQMQQIRPVAAIALSGYGMPEDVRRTQEAGFRAHLVKPVDVDQLLLLLDQIAADLEKTQLVSAE